MLEDPEQSAPPPPGTLDVPVAADSPTSFSAMSGPADQAPPAPAASLSYEPVGAPPPPSADPDRHPRARRAVRTGICGAAVIALVSIALLFVRWIHTDDANAIIIVGLPAEWDGAQVHVDG